MKLRVRAMGFAGGTVLALAVFASSIFSLWSGSGETIRHLEWVVPGFAQNSLTGVIVGVIGGFVWGFAGGALLAWFYNRFHKALYKSDATR